MRNIGYYFGVPLQAEVVIIIICGIFTCIFDASILNLNTNLYKIWNMAISSKFSGKTELTMKYLLSTILLVRTFSVHIHLAFYIVMLWPAIFEDKPGLILPWLFVGAVKNLGMGMLTTVTGLYACAVYGGFKPACLDFLLAQIISNAPPAYAWYTVLSYYRELKTFMLAMSSSTTLDSGKNKPYTDSELALRRRRARSLTGKDLTDKIDDGRNLISTSTIENIVHHLSVRSAGQNSRSLDALLTSMAVQAEQDEIMSIYDDALGDDEGMTVSEKSARILKLTGKEIERAKRQRGDRNLPLDFDDLNSISLRPKTPVIDVEKHPKPGSIRRNLTIRSSEKEINVISNDSYEYLKKIEEAPKTKVVEVNNEPVEVLKSPKTRKSSVSCQASPFGRGKEQGPAKDEASSKNITPLKSIKKSSPRNALTKPSSERNDHVDKVVAEEKASQHSKRRELREKDAPNGASSFKADGYTLAYEERKRKQQQKKHSA